MHWSDKLEDLKSVRVYMNNGFIDDYVPADIVSDDGDIIQLESGEQVIKWNKVEDGLPKKKR